MKSHRSLLSAVSIGCLCLLLAACGGDTGTKEDMFEVDETSTEDQETQEKRLTKTKKIFFNIPSPMETASLLKRAGASYNKELLNDIMNVNKYTSSSKQALNLGVYGADLSYTSVFDQTQESMFYTSCAQNLADKLGVSGAFNDETIGRLEQNLNDRDSLMAIISETYWAMDAYLKENDRSNLSALTFAGGWVEGLFIATQIANAEPTDELKQRIAEQKLSLGDLIELLGTYESDGNLMNVTNDMKSLQSIFDQIEVGGGTAEVTEENGVTVLGGSSAPATMSDDLLAELTEKVATIRNNYIN